MSVSRLRIEYYKNMLLSMNVARLHGDNNIAKPVLMLSIMQCIEEGTIIGNRIMLTKPLLDSYKNYFQLFQPHKLTSIVYPYYYLNHDAFYFIKGDTSRKTPSSKFLREHVEYAALDDDLWDLLQDKEIRDEYRQAIINHFIKR